MDGFQIRRRLTVLSSDQNFSILSTSLSAPCARRVAGNCWAVGLRQSWRQFHFRPHIGLLRVANNQGDLPSSAEPACGLDCGYH
jgi:hypothetical protein